MGKKGQARCVLFFRIVTKFFFRKRKKKQKRGEKLGKQPEQRKTDDQTDSLIDNDSTLSDICKFGISMEESNIQTELHDLDELLDLDDEVKLLYEKPSVPYEKFTEIERSDSPMQILNQDHKYVYTNKGTFSTYSRFHINRRNCHPHKELYIINERNF